MILHALFFYLFAAVLIGAALMVVMARNPVHSVLFLILCFFNAAALFVMLGAEFLAMILIVVYVGAVAVLFLFVVMMLDIDFVELRQGFLDYVPVGGLVGVVLLLEVLIGIGGLTLGGEGAWAGFSSSPDAGAGAGAALAPGNIEAIGQLLYTRYIFFFQLAGLVLLVAMIGAIVLTLRHRPGIKRQNIAAQVARRPEDAVEVVSVKSGEGLVR